MNDFNIGIVTFNRSKILVKNLNKLTKYQKYFNKIIVVNNASTDKTKYELKKFLKHSKIKIINLKKNHGLASRNVISKFSNSKYLIFIDDDAIIQNIHKIFTEIKNSFKKKNLGLINFKIIDQNLKRVIKREFPYRYNEKNLNKKLDVSYFIGAGFVLKKEIYKNFFFVNFFYGQEEIDLSYRLVKKGYKIEYNPKLVVNHYRDVRGRLTSNQVRFNNYYHKMILNNKYLPLPIEIISNFLWFFKTWKESNSLKLTISVLKKFNNFRKNKKIKKNKLDLRSLLHIFFTNGRLFY